MKKENKYIDKLTLGYVKNLEPDVPSADFTQNIMELLKTEVQPVYVVRKKSRLWLLLLIPFVLVSGGYTLFLLHLTPQMLWLWKVITQAIQLYFHMFASFSVQMKNTGGLSILVIIFAAMISLLTLEELLAKKLSSKKG